MILSVPQYLDRCADWKRQPDESAFAVLVAEAGRLCGSQRELALRLEVPEAVLSRWADGKVRPHPMLQEQVVDELREMVATAAAAEPTRASGARPLQRAGRRIFQPIMALGMRLRGRTRARN